MAQPLRITSAQVAALAGASQSAVSRSFTPGASVSARTAQRVRLAARALSYGPHVLARAMITGRSRRVGLAVVRGSARTSEPRTPTEEDIP